MILGIREDVHFYCFNDGVDMRKGIHSLYSLIKTNGNYSPFKGDAFVFIGSNLKSVKIIRWDKEGFLLYHKKLELGRYILPRNRSKESFFKLKSEDVDKLLTVVKHKNTTNDFKREIMLIL